MRLNWKEKVFKIFYAKNESALSLLLAGLDVTNRNEHLISSRAKMPISRVKRPLKAKI